MNKELYLKLVKDTDAEIEKLKAVKLAAEINYISANREFEDGEKVKVLN